MARPMLDERTMAFRNVVVGTDFEECSGAAVEHAIEIATAGDAALTIVHAYSVPYAYTGMSLAAIMPSVQDAADAELAKLLDVVRARVPRVDGVVVAGSPWEQILAVARARGADLVVVGSHGRKGLPRAVLGSTAERVVRLSPVPVLVVHGPSPAEALWRSSTAEVR